MLIKKASKLLERWILCDRCLGRQFAQLLKGRSNLERGRIVRSMIAMAIDAGSDLSIKMGNLSGSGVRSRKTLERGECELCKGIFDRLGRLAAQARKRLSSLQFESFLVGSRISPELVASQERIWESCGIKWCEPLKAELNRSIGKLLKEKLGKPFSKKPDVTVIFDLRQKKISLKIKPLFVEGKYKKLERGIPQTKWPTDEYKLSVEELLAEPLLKASGASKEKFHGAGREDIDARCLDWRPFVLELRRPKKRKLPYSKFEGKIDSKLEVKFFGQVPKARVKKIKEKKSDKTYKILAELQEPIKKLKKAKELEGIVSQSTPTRMLPKRADKTRKRSVKSLGIKKISNKLIKLRIRTEAGLYIKELISGDGGRTVPSLAGLLGTEAWVKQMDVEKIHL